MLKRTCNGVQAFPNLVSQILHYIPIKKIGFRIQAVNPKKFNQEDLLASEAGCEPDDICDFKLQACDTQPSVLGGAMKEFIFSGRLDNLCMSFCSKDRNFELFFLKLFSNAPLIALALWNGM
ncbi:hypothetical protein Syun_007542 [Stephania yunnanensis]|uniref:Uncharacterized protein n=1 Tax=Stephania yunnanensis TaxID=152371 RepID=A0AAP0Q2H2_9MAGN